MAVGDTSEAAPAAPAPSPGTSTSTRARSPAPLLCTTAAARAAAAAGGSGSVQGGPTTKQQRLPAWDPPRAVMQRQYLGQPFPGAAHEGFYLPPASDRRLPHEHLVLTYASHTAAGGRMAYNYPQVRSSALWFLSVSTATLYLPFLQGMKPPAGLCLCLVLYRTNDLSASVFPYRETNNNQQLPSLLRTPAPTPCWPWPPRPAPSRSPSGSTP